MDSSTASTRLSMAGFRYQLTSEGQAIHTNGRVRVLTIPADSIITVMGGPFNGARLVDIAWNGQSLLMFTDELRDHGRKLAA